MSRSLLIVESPAKSKTLKQYLGKEFDILASYGHVRDLRPKSGAVDTENNFRMHYEMLADSSRAVNAIIKALKKADILYLATDPDREGEAISWHLHELLKEKNALVGKEVKRVVFHEVTKRAVQEAVANPRELSIDLINAQQARRAFDYLVGFNLSPLLWKKIHRGLSAGRVQSPALRMIVEREAEIEAFKTQEYWTIETDLSQDNISFVAKLTDFENEKIKQFSINNSARAEVVRNKLMEAAAGQLKVEKVTKKQRQRHPSPPFTTSTLQQEAGRKLGFSSQRTMRIAQQLYEGVDVGHGEEGLITYMRTDSVHLAEEALQELRATIKAQYDDNSLPDKARYFKVKAKNAQEAHEAIRPTSAARLPNNIKAQLSVDQFKLYQLIWKRTMACQMSAATIDTVSVTFQCGTSGIFRASGSTVRIPGFMAVYLESLDDEKPIVAGNTLPVLTEGQLLALAEIRMEQHFTEPPPRYTEASLVKSLEEYGIGRPSTYVSIIQTLRHREYVEDDKKRFIPTEVGKLVIRFLTEHFADYVNYEFTAKLEDDLDAVSRGEQEWLPLMDNFWQAFSKQVQEKDASVSRGDAIQARVLGTDPDSGREVSVRIGRYGSYAQIGTKDDPDKPRFAGLREGQKSEQITLEEALDLFTLPRDLGETEDGEAVLANVGRFGPYIRYGDKFVSLPKTDDPYTVDLAHALELIAEKKALDAKREIKIFAKEGISVLNGRYGPYVTDGKKNVKIPKDQDPAKLTLPEAEALLAAPPKTRRRKKR